MAKKLDASLAVLNGAIGDYLAKTGNGLATETTFFAARGSRPLDLEPERLAAAFSLPPRRVVFLVHGLMCTENVWQMPGGGDYGSLLAADLGLCPIYVRYNTGLPIAESGASFARALELFVDGLPVPPEEIVLIGHSMGGLVVRSACHVARSEMQRWLPLVRRAVYLGTPHLGTPLERVGRVVAKLLRAVPDPYTRLVADIGDLRSAGIKDLGEGLRDARHPVPLLPEIEHFLVAASLSDPWLATLFGDALVPVSSATNGGLRLGTDVAPDNLRIVEGSDHMAIAHDPAVYAYIRGWCTEKANG
ncbi:MAG: alpha/beta hydrolase [Polyangiaceae bacterium]|jgi:triacylglycerol lipase